MQKSAITTSMAQFTEFTYAEIPEVFPDDRERTQELLGRVLDYDLAGFVMRRSGVVPSDPTELSQLQGGSIILGERTSLFMQDVAFDRDFGLHVDTCAPQREPLINLHTTIAGQALVRLFQAQPTIDPCLLPTLENGTLEDTENQEQYRLGRVDGELFIPVCHQTEVGPSDTVAFLDWRAAHDFITASAPRGYASGLYSIRRSTT